MFYDFFGNFQPPRRSACVAFHLSFHFFTCVLLAFYLCSPVFHLCSTCVHLCSTCAHFCFTCVPLVFHLCSTCVPLVFTCVHLCSTCVHLCSTCVQLCSTCVHLCSLVFTCVQSCSVVFYLCSTCVYLCSLVFFVFLLAWCFRLDLYMPHAMRRSPLDRLRNSTWIKEGKPCGSLICTFQAGENSLSTRCDCTGQLTHEAFLKTQNQLSQFQFLFNLSTTLQSVQEICVKN